MFGLLIRGLVAACFMAAVLPNAAAAASGATPSAVVENFHHSLLATMKSADELKVRGRYQKLEPEVEGAFNLPFMIQIAAGTKWRSATDDEKAKLIAAFKRVSVGTYASRFNGFSGERFETLSERDGPGGAKMVYTRIVRPNKEPVPITYVTRKFGDTWRVYDVIVSGGISELAVRRSEYNAILNDSGPGGLIARLNQKADQMLTP